VGRSGRWTSGRKEKPGQGLGREKKNGLVDLATRTERKVIGVTERRGEEIVGRKKKRR